jgi:tetratricopeptide (TPR) repeat protein
MDLAFSPDGHRVVVAARLQIKVLDAESGEEVLILRGLSQLVPHSGGFNASARFSPDGKRLVAVCGDSPFGVAEWWIEEATGLGHEATPRDLEAARRRGVVRLLTYKGSWDLPDSLSFRHDYEYARRALLVGDWEYFARARMHVRAHRPVAARADCVRALEIAPENDPVAVFLGGCCRTAADWDEAVAASAGVRRKRPDALHGWLLGADVELARGDRAAYVRLCREMLHRFGQTTDARVAATVAWRCLMPEVANELGDDRRLAEQLAGRAVLGPNGHPEVPECALARALAEQSAGHFEAARAWLNRCVVSPPNPLYPLVEFNRALVEQRLGRTDEARAALARGSAAQHQLWPPTGQTRDPGWWKWRVHAQALHRLVEAALNSPPSSR